MKRLQNLGAQDPVVTISRFNQSAEGDASLPGTKLDYTVTTSAALRQSQFKKGVALCTGVPEVNVRITAINDDFGRRRLTDHGITVGSKVSITYVVITSDAALARVASTIMQQDTSSFSSLLATNINRAGAAIPRLSSNDVQASRPLISTIIVYEAAVSPDDFVEASIFMKNSTAISIAANANRIGTAKIGNLVTTDTLHLSSETPSHSVLVDANNDDGDLSTALLLIIISVGVVVFGLLLVCVLKYCRAKPHSSKQRTPEQVTWPSESHLAHYAVQIKTPEDDPRLKIRSEPEPESAPSADAFDHIVPIRDVNAETAVPRNSDGLSALSGNLQSYKERLSTLLDTIASTSIESSPHEAVPPDMPRET